MAKVFAVNISEKKGTPKKRVAKALLIEDFGLRGDAHAGKGIRQVSLLARESVEKSKAQMKDRSGQRESAKARSPRISRRKASSCLRCLSERG